MSHIPRKTLIAAAVFAVAGPAAAQDTIKMGGLATLEGAFAVLGEDGMRGMRMALEEFNYTAGGKTIELITGSSDASPASAIRATRKLVEQDGVQIMIGPLSGSEGLAVKDYAKTKPDVTFLNGTSAAQDTTLRNPSPNFFRFSTDGAQWMAGLGEYAYEVKQYRKVAVLAEDYSFPYTQVFGFLEPFCRLGGKVPVDARFWVPIGNKDYSSVIAALPDDVDAIYVALGGADAINFLTQYQRSGGELPLIGGSDHRRPDRAGLEGQDPQHRDRHAFGRADFRYLGRRALGCLRRAVQETVLGEWRVPVTVRCSPMAITSTPRPRCWPWTRCRAICPTAVRSCGRRFRR